MGEPLLKPCSCPYCGAAPKRKDEGIYTTLRCPNRCLNVAVLTDLLIRYGENWLIQKWNREATPDDN